MIIYLNQTLVIDDIQGWFRKVGSSSNRPQWDTFLRKRAQCSARDLKWAYFLAWFLFKYLWVKNNYWRGKNIWLKKRQKLFKNLSQVVNFKPVSLHEILSYRDKQGITSEQRRRATSLTRPIFDEKRMKQERGAWQSMMGLRKWLCYIDIILASTVTENIFLPFFSRHDHA
jgi:hypothetical protein